MPRGEVTGCKPRVSADRIPPQGRRKAADQADKADSQSAEKSQEQHGESFVDDPDEPRARPEPKLSARREHARIRGPPESEPRKKENKAPRTPAPWRALPQAPAAYFIEEFCAAHRLSPSMYWKMKAMGEGPVEMLVGRRRMVSFEAAERWRRECEAAAAS